MGWWVLGGGLVSWSVFILFGGSFFLLEGMGFVLRAIVRMLGVLVTFCRGIDVFVVIGNIMRGQRERGGNTENRLNRTFCSELKIVSIE